MPETSFSDSTQQSKYQLWKSQQTPQQLRVYIVLIFIIAVGLALSTLYLLTLPKTTVPNLDSNIVSIPLETQPGIILRQFGNTPLPLSNEIDQAKYRQAIDAAWAESLNKAPGRVARFPNDQNLMAFTYYQPNEEPKAIVVYANQPIVVETEPIASLPNQRTSRISLEGNNYQLILKLQYTPEFTELDLPQALSDAFQMIANPTHPRHRCVVVGGVTLPVTLSR